MCRRNVVCLSLASPPAFARPHHCIIAPAMVLFCIMAFNPCSSVSRSSICCINPRCREYLRPKRFLTSAWLRAHQNVEGRLALCLAAAVTRKAGRWLLVYLSFCCMLQYVVSSASWHKYCRLKMRHIHFSLIRRLHCGAAPTPVDDVAVQNSSTPLRIT